MNSLWDILSVAIGVSFVFMILSLLNSWVQEYISTIFSLRSKNLANILQNMLTQERVRLNGKVKAFAQSVKLDEGDIIGQLRTNAINAFYEHPIIYSLSKPGALPSHIPSNNFAVALFDLLNKAGKQEVETPDDDITLENIKKGIKKLDAGLQDRLEALLYSAQINKKEKTKIDIEDFRDAVTNWFDSTMDRGSGWYKRKMQVIGIVSGIIIAMILNADAAGLSLALWQNSILRESVSQAAVVYVEQGDAASARDAQEQLLNLGLPIGWSFETADRDPATSDDPRDFPSTAGGWAAKFVGLILTGFAISQGAQIWFDLMNRLINLRVGGLKSEDPPSNDKRAKDEPQ